MRIIVSVLLLLCALAACRPAGGDVSAAPERDAPAESYKAYTTAMDRNLVGEFLRILASGDARLIRQLELSFEQAADASTHPDGPAELPESAEIYPFYLWGAVIERMRDLQLVSGFDPRAHFVFDSTVVRLRFLPESAVSSWREPADSSDWVAGIVELDRLSQQSGMRLVALDNGSDSYLFAIVKASEHDRFVEIGSMVGQRVRRIDEIPF
jgi:hypothetical protein